jgi:uncharacterized membrane protein YbhN (UPF0104 family)
MNNKATFFKISLSLALLVFLSTLLDWDQVAGSTANIQLLWWIPTIALLLGQIVVLAGRWQIMIHRADTPITYIDALRMSVLGNLANILIIASLGGILARIALAIRHGVSLARASTAAIADRLMTLVALVLMAGIFSFLIPAHLPTALVTAAKIGTALLIIAIAAFPFAFQYLLDTLPRKITSHPSIEYVREMTQSPRHVLLILGSSLIGQAFYFAAIILMTWVVAPEIDIPSLLALLPIITLLASLPISFGGWGVREGAFVFGLGLMGISPESAFIISVQIGFLSLLTTILCGVPALLNGNIKALLKQHCAKKADPAC